MSDATNALMELRAKVRENRKLLEKQEQALLVMEEMMGVAPHQVFAVTQPLSFYGGGIDINHLNASATVGKKTFKQEILDVIKLFGDQEFTVPHIHEALERTGYKVNGTQPRARIAIIVAELVGENIVEKTVPGGGSVPNKFKLITKENVEDEL